MSLRFAVNNAIGVFIIVLVAHAFAVYGGVTEWYGALALGLLTGSGLTALENYANRNWWKCDD